MTGLELHRVLCAALEIEETHGSRRKVSNRIRVSYSGYRTLAGNTKDDVPAGTVLNYCRRAGVRVIVEPPVPARGEVTIRQLPVPGLEGVLADEEG